MSMTPERFFAQVEGDKKDKAPSRCQRGDPRVRVACQPGGLKVKDRVEEREDTPWDGL